MITRGGYRLASMGDVMLDREVGRHFAEAPDDFAMPEIRTLLSGFDLVCLNLENPVATSGRPDPVQDPQVTFRARPETLAVLRTLGTSMVSLGNNHMLDYGEAALAETLEHLDAAGIGRVGAGRNYEEANRPLLLECRGRKVAFLSYTFIYSANSRMATRTQAGVSDHRMRSVLPRVRELSKAGYDVIVMSHWGYEYSFYPVPYQMRIARRLIDAGAALVLGHGPHYPQGLETHRNGQIVYSTGNFIFDEPHKYSNRGYICGVEVNDAGVASVPELYPFHIERHVPRLVDGAQHRRLANLAAALTRRYRTKDARFWKRQSVAYLTDICGRVMRTRSPKYLFVPTPSFYRDCGPMVIMGKIARAAGLARPARVR